MTRCNNCVKIGIAPWTGHSWCCDAHYDPKDYQQENCGFSDCAACQICGPECGGPYDRIYVNVYLVDRYFGGPEEGGWWYNAGVPIESLVVGSLKEAQVKREELEQGCYSNEGRQGIYEINSKGIFEVSIETQFAREYPEERPRYE